MKPRKIMLLGILPLAAVALGACAPVAGQQTAREQPGVLRSWQHKDAAGAQEQEQAKKGAVAPSPASRQKAEEMDRLEHSGRE